MQQLTGKFSSLFNLSNLITSNIYFDLNPIFTIIGVKLHPYVRLLYRTKVGGF